MQGLALWYRLRFMARDQRLLIVSALDVDEPTRERMEQLGIKFAQHRFEWLTAQPVAESFAEPTLVIGSAMSTDGLIHPEPYLEWLRDVAQDGPLAYFPHRRETPHLLELIGRIPNVRLKEHTIPIEMRLRRLRSGQLIRSLPPQWCLRCACCWVRNATRSFPKRCPNTGGPPRHPGSCASTCPIP